MKYLLPLLLISFFVACEAKKDIKQNHQHKVETASMISADADTSDKYEVQKSEQEWKQILTAEQYYVLREDGTEKPFDNAYWDNKKEGIYYCAACGQPLYSSKTKYKSGTGWPSFWEPIKAEFIGELEDNKLWMTRTEIVCSRCGSHIGHVFKDGPEPTGLRYCMNSAAMTFKEMDLTNVDEEKLTVINPH